MGIVWEDYHKGVPLLGVPGITLDTRVFGVPGMLLFVAVHLWIFHYLKVACSTRSWIRRPFQPDIHRINVHTPRQEIDRGFVSCVFLWFVSRMLQVPSRSLTRTAPEKLSDPNRKGWSSNHHGFQGLCKLRWCIFKLFLLTLGFQTPGEEVFEPQKHTLNTEPQEVFGRLG